MPGKPEKQVYGTIEGEIMYKARLTKHCIRQNAAGTPSIIIILI
jgi:hypothetical protein